MKSLMLSFLLVNYVEGAVNISATDDSDTTFSCLKGNTAVNLTCTITGSLTANVVWSKDGVTQQTCSNTVDNLCIAAPGYTETRYTFTSSVAQKEFRFHIASATVGTDNGTYTCRHVAESLDFGSTPCVCDSIEGNVPNSVVSTTAVSQGIVVTVSCEPGYTFSGDAGLTCLNNGSWDKSYPDCGTTTTSTTTPTSIRTSPTTTTHTTTTTTPSPSPSTTTPQPSSSTTTSTPNPTATSASSGATTLSPSTSTTSTSVNPETSTATTTSTAAVATTASTVPSPTTSTATTTAKLVTATPEGDSSKSLITMIIVVSVIGGILMLAIFLMIFLLVHWKNCIAQKGRQRHNTHSLYYSDQNRRPHRRFKHTKSKQRSEHSFQTHHVLEGYSFYRGGIKNPVFEDTFDSPALVYYRDNVPDYIEPPPEYQYANNWEELGKQ